MIFYISLKKLLGDPTSSTAVVFHDRQNMWVFKYQPSLATTTTATNKPIKKRRHLHWAMSKYWFPIHNAGQERSLSNIVS